MVLLYLKKILSSEAQEISLEQLSTGIPEMKIANLFEDIDILKRVQRLSNQIITEDPKLEQEKNERLNNLIKTKFTGKIEI